MCVVPNDSHQDLHYIGTNNIYELPSPSNYQVNKLFDQIQNVSQTVKQLHNSTDSHCTACESTMAYLFSVILAERMKGSDYILGHNLTYFQLNAKYICDFITFFFSKLAINNK